MLESMTLAQWWFIAVCSLGPTGLALLGVHGLAFEAKYGTPVRFAITALATIFHAGLALATFALLALFPVAG